MKQSQSPAKLTRKDKLGRSIRAGDWVRLVKIPPDVSKYMPRETQVIFKQALGKTFKIEAFNKYNLAELDLTKKVAKYNWIWVEPEFLLLFRRKRRKPK